MMYRRRTLTRLRNTLFGALLGLAGAACATDPADSPDGGGPGSADAGPGSVDGATPDAEPNAPDAEPPIDPNKDDDADGFPYSNDCDDNDPLIHPGATEIEANGKNDDCDGETDELLVCATGGNYAGIQAAIAAAPVGGLVEICPGTYLAHLHISKPIRLRGIGGAGVTIVDGSGTGIVAEAVGIAAPGVSIEGLTLTNGTSGGFGGGVRCDATTLSITDSVIANNTADSGGGLSANGCAITVVGTRVADNQANASGGGIYLLNSTGEIRDSEISGNTAHRGAGILQTEGAVAITNNQIALNIADEQAGGIFHSSDAPIVGNTVSQNQSGNRGGGITVDEHAPVLDSNTITNNVSGDDGGGVFVFISLATLTNNLFEGNDAGDDAGGLRILGSQATVIGNTLRNNTANGDGGAIKVSHNKSTMTDNLFEGNTANGKGGGLELDDDHSTILRCVFRGNQATTGGGIHSFVVGVPFRIEASLIADNVATNRGGGIHFEGNTARGTLSFLTVVNNTAPSRGGVDFSNTPVEVFNSIIAANSGTQVRFADGTTPAHWEYNNVFPAAFAGIAAPTGTDGNISVDPLFANSTDFELQSSSSCIDAADPSLLDADSTRADMGAHGGPEAL